LGAVFVVEGLVGLAHGEGDGQSPRGGMPLGRTRLPGAGRPRVAAGPACGLAGCLRVRWYRPGEAGPSGLDEASLKFLGAVKTIDRSASMVDDSRFLDRFYVHRL
jgi:hypothetical protein